MCGRYNLVSNAHALMDFFALADDVLETAPRYNIAPTQDVLAVRLEDTKRRLCTLRWGLVPSWSKGPDSRFSMINARAETVATKPAYRASFKRRRCLIPASGFYEWKQGEVKQPYHIQRQDNGLMAFAGLWEHWENDGQVIESCSIIVTAANPLLTQIHDRMPVILNPVDFETWLDPDSPPRNLQALLTPYSGNELELYPISRSVNSPKNDGPELIKQSSEST